MSTSHYADNNFAPEPLLLIDALVISYKDIIHPSRRNHKTWEIILIAESVRVTKASRGIRLNSNS